jgi:hypothetical protein
VPGEIKEPYLQLFTEFAEGHWLAGVGKFGPRPHPYAIPAHRRPRQGVGEQEYPEDIRLKYRFFDLRRERLHRNIMMRGAIIRAGSAISRRHFARLSRHVGFLAVNARSKNTELVESFLGLRRFQ